MRKRLVMCVCMCDVAFAVLRVYDLLCTNSRRTAHTNTHAHDSNRVSVEKGRSPEILKPSSATLPPAASSEHRAYAFGTTATERLPSTDQHTTDTGEAVRCVRACVRACLHACVRIRVARVRFAYIYIHTCTFPQANIN